MQLEQILESISDGFFALDVNYHVTYWNRGAEEGSGWKRSEVIGKHIFDIFPNAEGDELGEKYKCAMEQKVFQSHERRFIDSGNERWYDFRMYPNEDGLSVFLQNITEERRRELDREASFKISHAINTSNQVDDLSAQIVQIVAERYQMPGHHILLYLLRTHTDQLILAAPELPSVEWEKRLLVASLADDQPAALLESARRRQPIITSDVTRSSYYAFRPEEVLSSEDRTLALIPLVVEDELVGVMEILFHRSESLAEMELPFLSLVAGEVAVGISRRGLVDQLRVKNVDLEIQRTQTLEAHATLKRFLAFFSHELRSPLNSIIGFSDLITSEFPALDEKTVKEYVTSIHSSGTHLLRLINDILDLSKLEAGKLELHYTNIPIRHFLGGLKASLQPQLDQKQLDLQLQLTDELDDIVADDMRLKQILLNLITNAIKFSHSKGIIIVRVARIGTNVEFAVQDFGVGIPSEEIEKLFKPFQQTLGGAKKSEGTGLGLSITKKLIELHGGSVSVVSEWEKGSTFIVRMPMMVRSGEEGTEVVEQMAAVLHKSNAPQRVLVVEDKPHARQILQTYLTEAGYIVDFAINGIEALEKAKTWKPDAITLDILLPMKDGWQVLRELKAHPLCKNIPVIIISMVDERNVGFGLGAAEYFVKPVQKEVLTEAVAKVINRNAVLQRTAKILVIDDDRSVTDLIQVILESEGCTVLKAHSALEGLDIAESAQPDLIILDLVMPQISGFDVAYQLKHNPKTQAIPVMVMTSMELDDETRHQLEGFVVSLMRKTGFTKKDLLQEISSLEGKKERG
ncbi:MAG: response regulator [Ignavibacteriales bacterium]|nr:response regulator [Ignavibacteriales bacterium]